MGKITDLSNVNPYELERKFDEDKWLQPGQLTWGKFVQVNWDSDYGHVVDWQSEEQVIEYFDQDFGSQQLPFDATAYNLKDLMKFMPGFDRYVGSFKVNIPFEALDRFNYVVFEYKYPQPVPGPEQRTTRYYFFVTAINVISPNTTEVEIALDIFTQYKFMVDIYGLTLTQGHYAMAEVDADSFLSAPINAGLDLTADEPDLPSLKNRTKSVNLMSLYGSAPRVCIATTANLSSPQSFWAPNHEGTPPDSWWGGETLGWDGSTPVPASGSSYVNGANPGLRVYSITPGDYNAFINDARTKYPQFIRTIKAIYVLPSQLIDETTNISLMGYSLKEVLPQTTPAKMAELGLTKSLFGYAAENADYAKLYTGQFAEIIVSDNQGQQATVSINELAGSLELYARANSAFPFLKLNAFLDGIGGAGVKNYTVAPWGSQTAQVFNSRFSEFNFDLDVPVYGVYLDPRQDAGVENSINEWLKANEREASFESTENSIDTTYSNDVDGNTTQYNNAVANADTVFTNTQASITTERQNANASNSTILANANRTINEGAEIEEELLVVNRDSNVESIQAQYDTAWYNMMAADITNEMGLYTANLSNAGGAVLQAVSAQNSTMNIGTGVALSAIGGPVGVAAGAVSAAVSVGTIYNGMMAQIETDQALAEVQFQQQSWANYVNTSAMNFGSIGDTKTIGSVTATWPTMGINEIERSDGLSLGYVTDLGGGNFVYTGTSASRKIADLAYNKGLELNTMAYNANFTAIQDRKNNIETPNAQAEYNTEDANIERSLGTSTSTGTQNLNNIRSHDNAIATADASRDTANANAVRSRDTGDDNNAINRQLAHDEWTASEGLSYTNTPNNYGEFGGPGHIDQWGLRGLTVTVNTIDRASERLVGDYFRLKGYTMNSIKVENPTLSLMSEWTFWKADAIFLNAGTINDTNERLFREAFYRGITFWRNPDNVKNITLENVVSP